MESHCVTPLLMYWNVLFNLMILQLAHADADICNLFFFTADYRSLDNQTANKHMRSPRYQ